MPRRKKPAKVTLPAPAQDQMWFGLFSCPILTELVAAVVPIVIVPPVPEVDPDAKVTLALVIVQVGESDAPVGEAVSVQLLRVIVLGPI